MNEQQKEGIQSEFNMAIASLQRIHIIFDYINKAPHFPFYSNFFTPDKKFQAYLSVYEEINCIMSEEEREILQKEKEELTQIYNNFLKATINNSKQNKAKAIKYSSELNSRLTEFGIKLRIVLQTHKLLYKESADPGKALLE